jgi:cytochrome c biogenesis protein CcmG/thiol:disulfide interchange protein DsbE
MRRHTGRDDRATLKAAVVIAVIAVVAVGLWLGLRPVADDEPNNDAAGRVSSGPAPAFKLPRLTGGGQLSSDDLDGSPYVLNFWATWCDPCRAEMPAFEKVWQKYGPRDVVVVGVNINDDLAEAREFARRRGVTYPLVVDENDELAAALGVKGLPQTFFVDAAGDIVGSGARLGGLTEEELSTSIEGILEGGG